MASHRLATYSVGGTTRYGAVTDGGMIDLSARFGKDYPTTSSETGSASTRWIASSATGS